MRKIALALAVLGTTLVTALYTAPAHAQATRTWVSGVGDDANPCSRTAPCKTFAGAIAKTTAGGEIDNLDAGGFGALTITKSITIDGGGGAVASVLVAGTNGINVAAGSTDVVVIKNIRFQGLLGNGTTSGPGLIGLSYTSGAQVVCDTCAFIGFSTSGVGVSLSAVGIMEVRNSTFINNGTALTASATGGGVALVQVVNSSFVGTNSSGNPSQGGVLAGSASRVTVANSDFEDLTYGAQVQSGGTLNVDSSFFMTSVGIMTNSGTTANGANNGFYNGTACSGSGTLNSAKNNKIGNGATAGSCAVTQMTTE